MAVASYRMPRPDPEVERRSIGSGPVITYTLSPEELAKYGPPNPVIKSKPLPPALSSDKQRRKASTRYEEAKTMQTMSGPKNGKTNLDYLKARAEGCSIMSIEQAWGMKLNTLAFWIGKWGLRGVNQEKARELLKGEPDDANVDVARENVEASKTANVEVVALAGKAAEQQQAEIERLRHVLAEKIGECNKLQDEADLLRKEIGKSGGLSLDTYQTLASRTANTDWDVISVRIIRNPSLLPLLNFALGAAGEAGELADEIKKVIFHGHELDRDKLAKEIGDALWYLSQLARTLGYSFEIVADRNIEKLKQRYPDGFDSERSINRHEQR